MLFRANVSVLILLTTIELNISYHIFDVKKLFLCKWAKLPENLTSNSLILSDKKTSFVLFCFVLEGEREGE